MLKKKFVWKNKKLSSGTAIIILVVITLILVCGGGGAYWYYCIEVPRQEQEALRIQQEQKIQSDIAAVNAFYEKTLAGGNYLQVISLLREINRSRLLLDSIGFIEKDFVCNMKNCSFNYELAGNTIYNTPQKPFYGEYYDVSLIGAGESKKQRGASSGTKKNEDVFSYKNLPGIKQSSLLAGYKKRESLVFQRCSNIVNYINSYNSVFSSMPGPDRKTKLLSMDKYPQSPVMSTEKSLGTKVHYYGMLSAPLTLTIKETGIPHLVSVIQGLAYKESFIINGIELNEREGYKISGVMVCAN